MKALYQKFHSPALGFFLVRAMAGIIFATHGIMKLSSMEGTIAFFASLGFGAFLAWAVAIIETVGGIALVLGVFSKIFGALLTIIMLVALIKVKLPLGFVASEIDLMLLVTAIATLFNGCGKYSVCKFWHKDCADCKDNHNCVCACESK